MDGKFIIYIVFFLCIIGGVSAVLYTTDVDEAQKEFILTQQQLSQIEEATKQTRISCDLRKEAAAIITAAHIIDRDNEIIRTETRALEKKRDDLAKAFVGTIQRIREDSVGLILPEIALTTGSTLKNAKIQAVNEDITLIQHSEGVSKIPTNTLPNSLLDRFRFGYAPGGVGVIIESTPETPAVRQPNSGASINSTTNFRSGASDSLARLGMDGPSEKIQKPVPVRNISSSDPKVMAIEGNPSLWKSVERQSIGRAYIPGQGWLKIGPKGPIPGSGRH
ncbi:MAG: hypothetical protein ABL974_08300 [Prosthecobacter sp.]